MSHSPGPWEVGRRRPYIVALTRPDHRAKPSHFVSCGEPTGGNAWPDAGEGSPFDPEADARLIAAAPDLLGALGWMLTRFGMCGDEDHKDAKAIELARAAVAKATGQEGGDQ